MIYESDEFFIDYVKDPMLFGQIFKMRVDVWRAAENAPDNVVKNMAPNGIYIDEHDNHGTHFAVFSKFHGQIIGACRMCVHDKIMDTPDYPFFPKERALDKDFDFPIACYNRMIVLPQYQRKGVSKALDKIVIQHVKDLNVGTILGLANERRVKPLEEQGFIFFCEANQILEIPIKQNFYIFHGSESSKMKKDSIR